VRHAAQSGHRTSGIYLGALGVGYNTKVLASRGIPEPKCWADLLDPKFRDEVQVSDPNSSGTAYVMLASIVQLMGEDKGFEYLKALHRNVNQYTKSGAAPVKAVALGETGVAIAFLHDMVTQIVEGAPIKTVAPCEGTGYETGSVSLVKGARTRTSPAASSTGRSRRGPEARGRGPEDLLDPLQQGRPRLARRPQARRDEAHRLRHAKYGSAAERVRLLRKWDAEVKSAPK
jgi:iron(III) transport system substrate-binding protein